MDFRNRKLILEIELEIEKVIYYSLSVSFFF